VRRSNAVTTRSSTRPGFPPDAAAELSALHTRNFM
jgi:hypothetical protein